MGNIASQEQVPAGTMARRLTSRLEDQVLALVTAAIFTAATLLFWVQPMFGKIVLPLLGGTPTVWAATLLFFQSALLAGYLYAHAIGRFLPLRAQVIVHIAVLVLAAMTLPVGIPAGTEPPAGSMPVFWLLGLFAMTVGAPYTAVAATSPLLQRWFSMSSHPAATNPYRLYVASNAGSLIGLLGYPLLVEPLAGTLFQTVLWSASFVIMTGLIGISAWVLQASAGAQATSLAEPAPRVSAFDRFRWVALSFVPSSLLLGVTTHITTDIAAMPLLWAVPLALYLVTFIIAFADQPILSRSILLKIEALALALLSVQLLMGMQMMGMQSAATLATSLLAFFIIALARHSELVGVRPAAGNLTEFYLWMAAGGALGGVFNALVAPAAFDSILEYPLTLVAAAFTRLLVLPPDARWKIVPADLVLLALALLTVGALDAIAFDIETLPNYVVVAVVIPMAIAIYVAHETPWRFALSLAAVFVLLHGTHAAKVQTEARSFFGTYRILDKSDTGHVLLTHGTTIHGAQKVGEPRPTPLTYYAAEGPLGQAMRALQAATTTQHVGVVGMGTGASACYARTGDSWTFFEIDPLVVKLARDHGAFSFLRTCTPQARIVTGDARISLAREAPGAFDVLILDAFSSDAIPTHLATREALRIARERLRPGGVILFNISNRYLALEGVVANTARAAGLAGIRQFFEATPEQAAQMITSSHWIALSTDAAQLARIAQTGNWKTLQPDPEEAVWTDDYSSLLGVIKVK